MGMTKELCLSINNIVKLRKIEEEEGIGYFIVRPNGQRDFEKITKLVLAKEFEKVRYFPMDKYAKVSDKLMTWDEGNKKTINQRKAMKDFYGNYAIAIIIHDKRVKFKKFSEELRKLYYEINEIPRSRICLYGRFQSIGNYDKVVSNELFDISANIVEVSSDNKEKLIQQLAILIDQDVIDIDYAIESKKLEKLFKHKSFNVLFN